MKPSELLEKYATGRRDFNSANLEDANLHDANLRGANLYGADLEDANLHGANLRGADLRGASLYGADLEDANLRGADLEDANLHGANLEDANLHGANLPSPTAMLLAYWGSVSNALCVDLMRFDAWCHDDPAAFDRWADGGPCPYDSKSYQRAANFRECRELWSPGDPPRVWDLMIRCIKEGCANSDWH
jgi:hypothetical protein